MLYTRAAWESPAVILSVLLLGVVALLWYIASERFHLTQAQIAELSFYTLLLLAVVSISVLLPLTSRQRREKQWPHSPLVMAPARLERQMQAAWNEDCHHPGLRHSWHTLALARPGPGHAGDPARHDGRGKNHTPEKHHHPGPLSHRGPPEHPHRIPMIILDGKGDQEFFYDVLPHIHRAGRLHQLRLLNPSRPEYSVRYNPFHTDDDNYMAQVNMIFGSFNLHDEFFAKHQLNYLADIVRVLFYTGCRFNFYDVIVTALDAQVLQEQVEKASKRIDREAGISAQRKLNFQMSVKNLYQSFEDRERVPKIQGLLNECMTFLDDELSVVTGPMKICSRSTKSSKRS